MRILVTGSNGQLGSEIRSLSLLYQNYNWIFNDVNEFDFLNTSNIVPHLNNINPDLIINCAAYTDVEKAESQFEIAKLINYKAVDDISKWSSKKKSKLIHISTDYVFDGNSSVPLNEDAVTSPLNVYGETKLLGEKICMKNDPNSIVIRTSWIYSIFGKNFVKTMVSHMKKNNFLNVINDQIGSPTYAKDLAETIIHIINYKDWIPGLYHYSNEGKVSWFEFANSIKKFLNFNVEINGIPSREYNTLAKRPKYSLLDKSKIKTTFNITIPQYEKSLIKCIKILKNEK